jgi:hypothetical protein
MPYGNWHGEQDWVFTKRLRNRFEKLLESVDTRTAKFIPNRIAGGRMQTTRYGLGHILDIDGL